MARPFGCVLSDNTDAGLQLSPLEEKLRDAQIQIEELKRRNKALEEQLLLAENGKNVGYRDTVTVKPVGEKYLVLGTP